MSHGFIEQAKGKISISKSLERELISLLKNL